MLVSLRIILRVANKMISPGASSHPSILLITLYWPNDLWGCVRCVSASVQTRPTAHCTPVRCPDTQTGGSRPGWESSAVLTSRRISSSSWASQSWWRESCVQPGTWPAPLCWAGVFLSCRTILRIWSDYKYYFFINHYIVLYRFFSRH